MKGAAQDGRGEDAPGRRRPPWWAVAALALSALLLAVCVRDAVGWIGRPFAGFLFVRNRVIISFGRADWRPQHLRRAEWARIVAIEGRPVASAAAVHAAVAAEGPGRDLTYTLRRGADVFRLQLATRIFTASDFAVVFAPMLGTGFWLVLLGTALLTLRRDLPELRALFACCLAVGVVLITAADAYGPYRFTPLATLALAAIPAALLQLTATYPWQLGRWAPRLVAACWVTFAAIGALLVRYDADTAVFLPLLYLVYCAIANALILYTGSLVGAIVSQRHRRTQLILALASVVGSTAIAFVVVIAYPLLIGPIAPGWMILPLALMPLFSGIAFIALGPRERAAVA